MKQIETFYLRTYGCQMNELDSEIMVGLLEKRGLIRIDDEMTADLLIYNTCSIRDLAERKVMGKLGKMGKSRAHKRPIIGVTGCMANAKKESLFQKVPHIDFVLGTNNIHELNSVLDDLLQSGKQSTKVDSRFEHELDYTAAKRDDPFKAYVSIIRGCDKYCTYCVVPYTRGPEVSRNPDDIVLECQKLADKGYKEITLLGQNVNSYGKDVLEWNTLFHDLLYRLDSIHGIKRIRFMTSHPVDITRELMQAIRDLPSLCEFVHFPIQAGSNRILKKMHRLYTKEEYFEKVAMLREIVPNVSLGTDIIVGFPTETEAEFQETYDALAALRYSVAFLFAYSPRKGTPALRFKDDIPEEVKEERLQRLLALQEEIYKEDRQRMMGDIAEILVEKVSSKDEKILKGRTRCWKNAIFRCPEGHDPKKYVGTFQLIQLHSFVNQTLIGDLIQGELPKESVLKII